jgi:hypothetical protein
MHMFQLVNQFIHPLCQVVGTGHITEVPGFKSTHVITYWFNKSAYIYIRDKIFVSMFYGQMSCITEGFPYVLCTPMPAE